MASAHPVDSNGQPVAVLPPTGSVSIREQQAVARAGCAWRRMASDGYRHAFRGVCEELDWKPLRFVSRPPPVQVCSVCGTVTRRTGTLPPCRHAICGPCYGQLRALPGPFVCPLDGQDCREEILLWREFPVEDLLGLQVFCWNQGNGCSAVLAASELSRHFSLECQHHVASCPKCSTRIPYNDLCLHVKSCTGRQVPTVTEGAQGAGDNQQTADLAELKTMLSTAAQGFGQQLLDLKGQLERLSLEANMQAEALHSLFHTTNSLKEAQTDQGNAIARTVEDLKETLQHDLGAVASQTSAGIARNAADVRAVKDAVAETGQETLQKVDLVLRHNLKTACSHEWTLKGYSSLKNRALQDGTADRFTDPVYLCHYLILHGVYLQRNDSEVKIHMQVCLKKGEVDEHLQWPFNRVITLSVVHPDTDEKRTIECIPDDRKKFFARPPASGNTVFYVPSCFHSKDLERGGFIENNKLKLCFSLLT